MLFPFLEIRFVDILDILLSAYLMFAIYRLIRGTMAGKIVISILVFMTIWIIVRALNMGMLSAVMGSLVNIGLIALIIIFQPEIRKFLVMVSTRYSILRRFGVDQVLGGRQKEAESQAFLPAIVKACETMSANKTGALIVIAREIDLKEYVLTGEELSAQFSQRLIETIFFKNTPLHDGAMITNRQQIIAAGCILPVSKDMSIPKSFGLRHRSALGITEVSDAIAIVVSEETGNITLFDNSQIYPMNSAIELGEYLGKI